MNDLKGIMNLIMPLFNPRFLEISETQRLVSLEQQLLLDGGLKLQTEFD